MLLYLLQGGYPDNAPFCKVGPLLRPLTRLCHEMNMYCTFKRNSTQGAWPRQKSYSLVFSVSNFRKLELESDTTTSPLRVRSVLFYPSTSQLYEGTLPCTAWNTNVIIQNAPFNKAHSSNFSTKTLRGWRNYRNPPDTVSRSARMASKSLRISRMRRQPSESDIEKRFFRSA